MESWNFRKATAVELKVDAVCGVALLLSTYKEKMESSLIVFGGSFRILKKAADTGNININCADPLGRSALLMAIDNENLEMVELLLEYRVETKDALLHAISEEYVEAVEVLLEHEDAVHKPGEPHVTFSCMKEMGSPPLGGG